MDTTQNKNSGDFKITGNWNQQSKSLKEKFPQLTDSDLKFETGQEKELLEKVAIKLNKKPEEVRNIISKGQSENKRPDVEQSEKD